VVGLGSVGGFIAEGLARTGIQQVTLMDFDQVEEHNLDRLLYAKSSDVGRPKVDVVKERLEEIATAKPFDALAVNGPAFDESSFVRIRDCDVIVACVDRPWGRHVLNYLAYTCLIPVVDGGIYVRKNRHDKLVAADWRATIASPGRACLQCVGQYDSALVQLEREGILDQPRYIDELPDDHVLKRRENVFAFSMACASMQLLQMLALVVNPLDQPDQGLQRYHFVGGRMEPEDHSPCHPNCLFPSLTARGDAGGFEVLRKDRPSKKPSWLKQLLLGWFGKH
jgi:molybdopterin-synthase adenylyltransferase